MQHLNDSSSQFKVLLVDDDDQRRQSLSHIFSFIGVNSLVLTFVDWFQQPEKAQNCSLAFIGRSSLPISLEKMISRFQKVGEDVSLCLLESWDEQEQLSLASKKLILRTLDSPLTERVLTDLLHEAQIVEQVAESTHEADEGMFPLLIGKSAAMKGLKTVMARVIDRDTNVLITGESGTGKELVAKSLHDHSERSDKPFVPVNCGAIPPELLESELFGHEKGAFTGAVSARIGRFEMAQGGTLFLDEIGDMPLNMQVKLLRVLQEKNFERVGGSKTITTDVRVIAATHKNLEAMVESKEFREDLYYRLNVYPIETPPLRDRKGDVVLLLHELAQRSENDGFGHLRFHTSAIESLQRHQWPGNVRELSNLIERLAIMYPDGVIGVSELPERFRHVSDPEPTRYHAQDSLSLNEQSDRIVLDIPAVTSLPFNLATAPTDKSIKLPDDGIDLKAYLEGQEQDLIKQALGRTNNVVTKAADLLKIRRTTLVQKIRKYDIQRSK